MTRSNITAAPAPIEIGGVEYLATPLTDKDIAELDNWVQQRYIKTARSSLPDDATEKERDETLSIAFRQSMGITWMNGTGAKIIATVEGMVRLMWQMLRKEHPELTFAVLQEQLFSAEHIANVNKMFTRLNISDEQLKKTRKRKTPTKKKKRKKKRQKS